MLFLKKFYFTRLCPIFLLRLCLNMKSNMEMKDCCVAGGDRDEDCASISDQYMPD